MTDPRDRKSKWIAVSVMIAMLLGAALLMVRNHAPHWLVRSKTFSFYLRKAGGVEKGTPVWVNGIEAGQVIDMEPETVPATFLGGKVAEGKIFAVKVTCRVFKPYHRMMREGSTVEVLMLSVFGMHRVNVYPGVPGAPRAPDGAIFAQHVSRGIEGTAEEILDRAERMDKTRRELIVFLDAAEKNTDEIEDTYKRGGNTLHAMVEKGMPREILKEAQETFERDAKALGETIRSIDEPLKEIDENLADRISDDLAVIEKNFKESRQILLAARDPLFEQIDEFDRQAKLAGELSDRAKAFHQKYKVFQKYQKALVPGMLADYYGIARNLIRRTMTYNAISRQPDPVVEKVLRQIARGRLKQARMKEEDIKRMITKPGYVTDGEEGKGEDGDDR